MQGRFQGRFKELFDYPGQWLFKVIGKDGHSIREAVSQILSPRKYRIEFSNISLKGNYTAFNIYVIVKDKADRDQLYKRLKEHPVIKAVI